MAVVDVGRELSEMAERLRRSTVQVRGADSGRGSGVVWRPDGLVLTNAHVASASRHTVQMADGRVFDAELLRRNPRLDLAVLHIEAAGLPSAEARDPASLRPGELVIAIGNPIDGAGALAIGVVAATPGPDDTFLRADIRLAPGNSGGPLADTEGKVLGINSMVMDGFGVAVTSTAANAFVNADRRIGATLSPVAVHLRRIRTLGLMVVALEPGGPAHLSGMLVGDVIVRVGGRPLNSPGQLSDAIQSADVLPIELLRAGRLRSCEIAVARESAPEAA